VKCILCAEHELEPWNGSEVCQECRLLVADLLAVAIPERWAAVDVPGTDGSLLVSDQGRVARLLPIDRSGKYPRVSLLCRKFYVHALVAAGFHGPRPRGALVLHGDDDPSHFTPENLRYGDHKANAQDRKRNTRRRRKAQTT
jgi:hypothetical protein